MLVLVDIPVSPNRRLNVTLGPYTGAHCTPRRRKGSHEGTGSLGSDVEGW
jgi:hypothetical protein